VRLSLWRSAAGNRLARDLDLELLGDVGFVKGPPQSGQTWGKGAFTDHSGYLFYQKRG
jgi:hypothetical protein